MNSNIVVSLLKTGLIENFYKNSRYNDEPLLYQYTAFAKRGSNKAIGSGMSFNRTHAQTKALGEAIERLCLDCQPSDKIIYSDKYSLDSDFLDPLDVVSLSAAQKKEKKYKDFLFDNNSKFGWVQGVNIKNQKNTWIPAQLVYVPYSYEQNEPVIRFPISTGAALGTSLETALYRGICEVIERDSFLIFYLNRLHAQEIDLNSEKDLRNIRKLFQRYNLDVKVYDITTDISIPVAMCLIIDRTRIGPYISIGLKCSLDLNEAVIGSIEEAQHTRPWMRDEVSKVDMKWLSKVKHDSKLITDPKERGLFWYDGKLANKMDFWLSNQDNKITITSRATQKKK